MVDLPALKRTRAGHRAVATRRVREVADLFTATPDPDPLRLEQLKRGLQDTFDTLKQLEGEIILHVDPGDVGTEIEESERIKDQLQLNLRSDFFL